MHIHVHHSLLGTPGTPAISTIFTFVTNSNDAFFCSPLEAIYYQIQFSSKFIVKMDAVGVEQKSVAAVLKCGACLKDCGDLHCARCKTTYYCNIECQKAHWKVHKKSCLPAPKPGEWPPLPPLKVTEKGSVNSLTRGEAMAKAKAIDLMNATTVCSRCEKPTVCMSTSEMKLPGGANKNGCSANAMFMCAQGHTTFVSDARVSSEQNCHCKINIPTALTISTEQQSLARCSLSSATPRLLIVMGLGGVPVNESVYLQRLKPVLKALNIGYDVILAEVSKPAQLTDRLATGSYNSVLLLHVLDSGFEEKGAMFAGEHLMNLCAWVQVGGRLLVHGEGDRLGQFMQTLVAKPWHFCGDFYRKCKYVCNFGKFTPFRICEIASVGATETVNVDTASPSSNDATDVTAGAGAGAASVNNRTGSISCTSVALPRRLTAKAVMLSGVSEENRLYYPGHDSVAISGVPGFGGHIVPSNRVAVAVSSVHDGLFVYIGDANAEIKTINLITSIINMKSDSSGSERAV